MTALLSIDRASLAAGRDVVIKADEFATLVEARETLRLARRAAEQMRATVDAEIEQARARGYEAGLREARAELSTQIAETKAQLEHAFVSLEGRIVQTVLKAVQQILGHTNDRALLEPLIRRVLGQSNSTTPMRLRVSAEQFDAANDAVASLLKEFPQVEWIDVAKDPNATRGTCVLETEFGVIDGSIDTQLAALRRGLLNAFVGKRLASDLRAPD
ncbi:Yop proteins translocation protein L [Steroidobacter agaridevorans]|uniref:Type 3 secretion system stator protein n=1 Tax=Steroidobacter agaridevorans TaxID=2695856 RepID=A0A829YGL3_9GAMM|nr:type III secretion system stator protein SctL [Steroidobacter agaridevorans]GFE82384.1 Yop proteins translocation protein L [Steroidobacter agaridevorans]GFE85227.1 Yop proteins translocation protein L [Steroidobacter agaridevorans]